MLVQRTRVAQRTRFTISLLLAAAFTPTNGYAQPVPPPPGSTPPPVATVPLPPPAGAPAAQPAAPIPPPPVVAAPQPPPPAVGDPVQRPPPPGGWQAQPQPYSPPGYGWGPPVMPPPDPPESSREVGVTPRGIPFGQRGGFILDGSGLSGPDVAGGSLVVVGSMPLVGKTYFDAHLPIGVADEAIIGNPTLSIRSMVRVSKSFWFLGGGGIGLPVLQRRPDDPVAVASASRAFWDLHEFFPEILPIMARFGVEGHAGDLVILRAQLDPMLFIAVRENDEMEFVLQHSAELQIGHTIGAGLRIQGVAMPTFEELGTRHITEEDLYQFAMEPFFVVERDLAFLRVGLLLPMDAQLGPPLTTSWSVRLATGLRID